MISYSDAAAYPLVGIGISRLRTTAPRPAIVRVPDTDNAAASVNVAHWLAVQERPSAGSGLLTASQGTTDLAHGRHPPTASRPHAPVAVTLAPNRQALA